MSAASTACQQLVKHVSLGRAKSSMSAASKACQQLAQHVSLGRAKHCPCKVEWLMIAAMILPIPSIPGSLR
jgi:hypothetical protein